MQTRVGVAKFATNITMWKSEELKPHAGRLMIVKQTNMNIKQT